MLALTYQQRPKKEKTTIRLKRISQRFLPSYKNVKEQRFDVFGGFSRKKGTKQFVSLLSKKLPSIQIRRTYGLTPQRVRSKVMKFNWLKETQRPSIETKVLRKSNMNYTALPWYDRQSNSTVIKRERVSGLYQNSLYKQSLLHLPSSSNVFNTKKVDSKLLKILHPSRRPKKRFAYWFDKNKNYGSVNDQLTIKHVKKLKKRGELQYIRGIDEPNYKFRSRNLAKSWEKKAPYIFGNRATKTNTKVITFPQQPKVIRKYKFIDYKKEKRVRPVFSGPLQILWNQIRGNKVLGDLSSFLRSRFFARLKYIPFRIDDYSQNKKRKRTTAYKMMVFAYRRLRLFYGQLKEHKMRLLLKKTTGRQHASFIFGKMERRLDVLLWRTNICDTIHMAQQIVKNGCILVDGVKVRNYFYPIKTFQFISLNSDSLRQYIKTQLFEKLRLKKLKFPFLKYIKMDYKQIIFYCLPIVRPYKFVPMSYKLRHSSLKKFVK